MSTPHFYVSPNLPRISVITNTYKVESIIPDNIRKISTMKLIALCDKIVCLFNEPKGIFYENNLFFITCRISIYTIGITAHRNMKSTTCIFHYI